MWVSASGSGKGSQLHSVTSTLAIDRFSAISWDATQCARDIPESFITEIKLVTDSIVI